MRLCLAFSAALSFSICTHSGSFAAFAVFQSLTRWELMALRSGLVCQLSAHCLHRMAAFPLPSMGFLQSLHCRGGARLAESCLRRAASGVLHSSQYRKFPPCFTGFWNPFPQSWHGLVGSTCLGSIWRARYLDCAFRADSRCLSATHSGPSQNLAVECRREMSAPHPSLRHIRCPLPARLRFRLSLP